MLIFKYLQLTKTFIDADIFKRTIKKLLASDIMTLSLKNSFDPVFIFMIVYLFYELFDSNLNTDEFIIYVRSIVK